MAVTITFPILFEVKIFHHYFLNRGETAFESMSAGEKAEMMLKYDVRDFFEIVPTSACQKVLDDHHGVFRATSQGFIVGIRAEKAENNPGKWMPFHILAPEQEFTFLLRMKDMNFLNYTALPLVGNEGKMYVFCNPPGDPAQPFPHLAAYPPVYVNGGQVYYPGDMLVNDSLNPTTLYTASLKNQIDPESPGEAWTSGTLQGDVPVFANVSDRHPVVRGILRKRTEHVYKPEEVTIKDAGGNLISPRIDILNGDEPLVRADMQDFPDGFYRAVFESQQVPAHKEELLFYLLRERFSPFAVINLAAEAGVAQYNMTGSDGSLRSPVYHLHFLNRRTHWRYVSHDFNEPFVTDNPLPLTRYGVIQNLTTKNKYNEDVELPNPGKAPIKAEALTDPDEDRFYSEVHIHSLKQ